jgi:hypothetical protein
VPLEPDELLSMLRARRNAHRRLVSAFVNLHERNDSDATVAERAPAPSDGVRLLRSSKDRFAAFAFNQGQRLRRHPSAFDKFEPRRFGIFDERTVRRVRELPLLDLSAKLLFQERKGVVIDVRSARLVRKNADRLAVNRLYRSG